MANEDLCYGTQEKGDNTKYLVTTMRQWLRTKILRY
jgi:hypothetical protein